MSRPLWLVALLSWPLAVVAGDEASRTVPPLTQEHPRVVHLMSWQRSALPPALELPRENYPEPTALDRAELLKYLEYRQRLREPPRQ